MNVPERVRWAVDRLGLCGGEHVLEVGGGPGVSAGLICAALTTGRLLAVDRSPTATRATAERNAPHVEAGRLAVLGRALADLDPADVTGALGGRVDVALTVDVNVFWVDDAPAEAAVLHRVLSPGAVLHVLYGAGGPTPADRVVPRVRAALGGAGFVDLADVAEPPGFGVRARRP
ncbi:class I SAM-dependent methyltransferase [Cellulomonas sp. NS3]|uniref:class I SAM-dependent methyltransferase n=1 Tax=Cellulomonas sp. NS3 TaxID=2973977 RepID=UPI002162EFDE|nr:class I SAM-dependent methyltransferase [Cellulomonas sp. NS3]